MNTMLEQLLATKFHRPPLPPGLIARPRLMASLAGGLGRSLTVISTPAGFGKTTLAAAWAAQCGRPSAWLSLDQDDNDPRSFLVYLIAALQTIQADLGASWKDLLLASPTPLSLTTLLTPLINEVGCLPQEFVLVLDDYHLLEAQPIHDAMTFLIDHRPPQLHLVIATRADPPLPLPRLRASGQLVELRQADLRFTLEEAAEFFRQAAGVDLPPESLGRLAGRTEGWAAGLQIAAISMRESADADGFIQAFTGANRHILDYLTEEVLHRQPPERQAFLLQTSILERLSGPLCDAVLPPTPGAPAAAETLQDLERANLFIAPLDDRREWYRYHHLFADLLQHRLRQSAPDSIAGLHRRASLWFEQHGDPAAAIRHAQAAGDLERAADLIEAATPRAWRQGQLASLLDWADALPVEVVRARPQLCLYRALALFMQLRSFDQLEDLIQATAAADPDGQFQGEIDLLRGVLATYRNDLPGGLALTRKALERIPESSLLHNLALRSLSALLMLTGNMDEASQLVEAELRHSHQVGDQLAAAVTLRRMGSLCLFRGQLRQAEAFYQRSLEASRDEQGHPWPIAAIALQHLAEICLERNDLAGAERHLAESMALLEDFIPAWNAGGYLLLARLRQARDQPAEARQALERAQALALESDTPLDDLLTNYFQLRQQLRQGELEPARRWAAGLEARPTGGAAERDLERMISISYLFVAEQLLLARLDLAQGQPARALERLDELPARAGQRASLSSQIEAGLLKARAHHDLGQAEAARKSLEASLSLARPEGFIRLFLDEGGPVGHLLAEFRPRLEPALLIEFAGRVLAAASAIDSPPTPAGLAEALNERETEILALIADGLSNQEIAARLYLSLPTIKWHASRLYAKLGVQSRTQAVARARELDLLNSG